MEPTTTWTRTALLFRQWRSGDVAALDDLVRETTPRLWQLARSYRLEPHVAEDVVQNTWLALVRHADSINDPQAVSAWLGVTTRREAWRVARQTRDIPTETESFDRPADVDIEVSVLADADARVLWRAVAALSERCQRLLRVIAFEDRPNYRELADQLSMPVGSIGPTRGRCLAKLRTLLGDDAGSL